MQNAILEERILKEEESEEEIVYIEDGIYTGNRFSAAMQFARYIVRYNQECLKHPVENKRFYDANFLGRFKDNLDKKSSFVLDAIGPYLCYLTALNSSIYALLKLKYSEQDKGYTFPKFSKQSLPKKSENKFSIVG